MKNDFLARYERDDQGGVIIDVSATRVEDLYNGFDKTSPYIRRDLDKDLVDYLVSCVSELTDHKFVIRFAIASPLGATRPSKVQNSVKEYFLYLLKREKRKLLKMFRRSAFFLVLGIAILSASVSISRLDRSAGHVLSNVLAEGLMIIAWVSLWEAFAVFLVDWFPHRRSILVFRSVANAELRFRFIETRESMERTFAASETPSHKYKRPAERRHGESVKARLHKEARRRRRR